jgi:GMP synthase (glutamine-hydrolysing)
MKKNNWIAILDYGSQYSQLIARRVREQHVYSELMLYNTPVSELAKRAPAGIILSFKRFREGRPVV